MADRTLQTYNDSDVEGRESMHPYKSLWMDRWMQTSYNSESRVQNRHSLERESKEDEGTKESPTFLPIDESRKVTRLEVDVGPSNISEYRDAWKRGRDLASDVTQSANGVGMVIESRRVQLITSETVEMNSQNLRNAKSVWKPFPMFDISKKREPILAPTKDPAVYKRLASGSQIDYNPGYGDTVVSTSKPYFPSSVLSLDPTDIEFPTRDYHSQPEGTPQSSGKRVKPSIEMKNMPGSGTLQDKMIRSTSNIVPYGFEFRGTPIWSHMQRNKETDQSSTGLASQGHLSDTKFTHVEHEHRNFGSFSSFLVRDQHMDNIPKATNFGSPCLWQKDSALQPRDPSTSDFSFPKFVEEQGQMMCNFSGTRCLSSHSSPSGLTKSKELKRGSHSLHRMPTCSVHDMETLRVCPTLNSVEGVPGSIPKFSQTTHHMSITEKTDVSLSKGGQMMRESTLSTEFKGNAFLELMTIAPDIGGHGKHGAKLHPLWNSMDSEGKEDVQDVKTGSPSSRNESSAETDTMDIDVCQTRNSVPGVASSPSIEYADKSHATVALLREEVGSRKAETELPDMNQEPPAFSPAADSMENRELSASRTESLDVEHLLCHAEQPESSKSRPQQAGPLSLEPSSRWIKRLKVNASDSIAHGTKIGDSSSSEKANKFFSNVMNYNKTNPEFTFGKRLRKRQMKTMTLLSNKESSSMDLVKKRWDLTLSHPWIQRWCHDGAAAPREKPVTPVVCEPHSSKAALVELGRKQFPSIAAMALMGKAMGGFECEFRKRGSFVVWNTEGFENTLGCKMHTGGQILEFPKTCR